MDLDVGNQNIIEEVVFLNKQRKPVRRLLAVLLAVLMVCGGAGQVLHVSAAAAPSIITAYARQSVVDSGDDVRLYAKTNDAVERVELWNEFGERTSLQTTPTTHANGEKEWDWTWMTEKLGTNRPVVVRAWNGLSDTDAYVTYTIYVTVVSAGIRSASVSPTSVQQNGKATFSVETSKDINEIRVYDGDYFWGQQTGYTDTLNRRLWSLDLNPSTAGNYSLTVRAISDAGIVATKTLPLAVTAATVPSGYTGIYNASDLNNIRNNLSGSYILMNDIDLGGMNWTPIGTSSSMFTGILNGNGHSIKNLTIDVTSSQEIRVALFGYIEGGCVLNLGLVGGSIQATTTATGYFPINAAPLACRVGNSTIQNCYSTVNVTVTGRDSTDQNNIAVAGGLVTYLQNGSSLTNCFSRGNVTVTNFYNTNLGGLVGGMTENSFLDNCFYAGTITAGPRTPGAAYMYVGSVVGYDGAGAGTISNCYYINTFATATGYRGGSTTRTNLVSRTLAQMKTTDAYPTFNFTGVWGIAAGENDGFPYLQGLAAGTLLTRSQIYSFANSSSAFTSRYDISDRDFDKLAKYVRELYADTAANQIINQMQDMRNSSWTGSPYGMAVTAILDKQGRINLKNGNFGPQVATLSEIARPADNAALRSAINYYQVAQSIPHLRAGHYNKTTPTAWSIALERLVQAAQNGELILFSYWFNIGGYPVGHAIAIIGYEPGAGGSHNLIAYDNRYPGRDVIVNVDSGYNICVVDGTEECESIEYLSDMSPFDAIDIDGPDNDMFIPLFDSYTITYDANGGSGAPGSQTKTHDVALTLSAIQPTRPGFTFVGWATSSTAAATQHQPGGSYTANASVTLYAKWLAASSILPLASPLGAGIGAAGSTLYFYFTPTVSGTYEFFSTGDSDTYGYLFDVNLNELQRDDNSGTDRNFRISCPLTAGNTYYLGARLADSTALGNFGLFFIKSPEPLQLGVSKAVTIAEAREGFFYSFTPAASGNYEFRSTDNSSDTIGWLYDADWNVVASDAVSSYSGSRNFLITHALTAGSTYYLGARLNDDWITGSFSVSVTQAEATYTATFIDYAGTAKTQRTAVGGTITMPAINTCEGWSNVIYGAPTPGAWTARTSPFDPVEELVEEGSEYTLTADTTFYAEYGAEVGLEYHAGIPNHVLSGGITGAKIFNSYDRSVILYPEFTLPQTTAPSNVCASLEWKVGDTWYPAGTAIELEEDYPEVVIGRWVGQHTVALYTAPESLLSEIVVSDGSEYGAMPIPGKNGYAFAGWYTEEDGAGTEISAYTVADFNAYQEIYGSSYQKLYAKWIPDACNVTLDRRSGTGGSGSVTAAYDANMPPASMPTRPGYTFAGYYDAVSGGVQYYTAAGTSARAWDKTGEGNMTLYARWTANRYTITFDKQNGTGGSNSVTATYDANMPSATMPTRQGYIFTGYYDAESGGTQYYTATGASARAWNKPDNTTLYAAWQPGRQLDRSETYAFDNSDSSFGSSYYITDDDFSKLSDYISRQYSAENAGIVINKLQAQRDSTWEGSCYGMSTTAILNKQSRISMRNFAPGAATLRAVAVPTSNNAVRSAINYYHVSQYIPFVRSFCFESKNPTVWRIGLQRLVESAQAGDLLLFCYSFPKDGKTPGHAIVIIGYEQGADGSHNLIAYDNRYPDRDLIVNIDTGFNMCIVDGREECMSVEYTSDMSAFDKIDIDGLNNNMVFTPVNGNQTLADTEISILAQGTTTVTNKAGQTLTYNAETGEISGTMEVLATHMVVNSTAGGEPAPVTKIFVVPNSDSFTLKSGGQGIDVSITSKDMFASASSASADTVAVAKNEGVTVLGKGEIDYSASLGINNSLADMVRVDGKATGGASLQYSGGNIKASGTAYGAALTVFSNKVDVETVEFATPANTVLITGDGSGKAGNVDIKFDSNGDGSFDKSVFDTTQKPVANGSTSVTLDYVGSMQLSVTGENLTWSGGNQSVSVDQNGKITSLKNFSKTGSATIRAANSAGFVEFSVSVKPTFMQWIMIVVLFGWIWM